MTGPVYVTVDAISIDMLVLPSPSSTEAIIQDGVTFGLGFVYEGPSITDAVLVTATPTGTHCVANDGGPFTGRVVIGQSETSFAPFLLQ